MPTTKKIFTVQNLEEKLNQAKGLVLTDYRGLNVTAINQLRRKIKKAGGEYQVVKNTLLNLASQESKIEIDKSSLVEPTAVVWVYKQDPAPLKILHQSIQETGLPKVKSGVWDKKTISIEKINQLANLPGIEELKVKLTGTLQSPISGLTNSLSWNLKKLIFILKSEARKK